MLESILSRLRGPKTPVGVTNVGLRTPAEMLKLASPAEELRLHRPDQQLALHAPKEGLKAPKR
nr:K226 [uncultured bacterium]